MTRAISASFILLLTCELQQCTGATLCVKLRSIFSKAVPGVSVRIVDPNESSIISGSTDSNGEFCASELRPGSYSLEVRPAFYLAATYWNVVVSPSSERWLEVELYAREIRGLEVLSSAELVGQLESQKTGEKPTRICVEVMKRRTCVPLSKWGEYRLAIPLGRVVVWFETAEGSIICKKALTISVSERISVGCAP